MHSVEQLLTKLNLTVVTTFTSGHKCQTVYKVCTADHRSLVLKVGTDPQAIAEIQKNLRGYDNLRKAGLNFFIPEIVDSNKSRYEAFILMEYCGNCFSELALRSKKPHRLYERLVETVSSVYSVSKTDGTSARTFLSNVQSEICKQYRRYLQHIFDPTRLIESLLENVIHVIDFNCPHCCFASWDFTPQNVFLTRGGVKYVDPNDIVVGIPIIDIACFAGVIRDVQKLPGSASGYGLLEESAFATGHMLGLSEEKTHKLFNLGRVLQNFLSARFRVETDKVRAHKFFEEGRVYLEKIVQ